MIDSASPLPRYCVVSQETRNEALTQFASLTRGLSKTETVIVSHCEAPFFADVTQIRFRDLKQQLGNNHAAIFLDLSAGLHLTALSILAGTLRGGGLLVLYLGPDWCQQADQELARFLPWPLDTDAIRSPYKTLFWQALNDSKSPFSGQWPRSITPYYESNKVLTSAQSSFIKQVLERPPSSHILIAARGRGKSFALAELLYCAQQQAHTCYCTASSRHNLATLEQHFQSLSGHAAPFMAPDEVLNCSVHFDLLVVDEAASLPLPMLEQMVSKAKRVVFSSTDYGYEGSGRGFGLRFRQQRRQAKHTCHEYTLEQPLRWGENDPLEHWLNHLLFKAYQPNLTLGSMPSALRAEQWQNRGQLLDQAFSLLVSAHYQTTPENKRWLVDDPSVTTFLLNRNQRLLAVAVVTEEGCLPDDLSTQVAQGRRRPRGHLVPQSLLAHEGLLDAGGYSYWRISRIAVAPDAQRQGLGSELIESIEQAARAQGIDFLCTSFAATPDVVPFWQTNGFHAVRLGSAKDQASGAYSLMMLKGLSTRAQQRVRVWCPQFSRQWFSALPLRLQQLSPELINSVAHSCCMGEKPHISALTDKDVSDLALFADYHRPYESVRTALLALALNLLEQRKLQNHSPQHLLLLGCALNITTEKDAHSLGFSGKKALLNALKATVKDFMSLLKNG